MYIGLNCSLMWLKNGIAPYPLVSAPYKILELFPSNSFICWHQVRKKYGLEKICALDSSILCYCNWVNSYGVLRWQRGNEEKFWSVVSKSVRLLDRMARVQHMVHLLYRFETLHPPPIKLSESSIEYGHENACGLPVRHTFFVYELKWSEEKGDGELRRDVTAMDRCDCRYRGKPSHAGTCSRSLLKYIIWPFISIPCQKLCQQEWMNSSNYFAIISPSDWSERRLCQHAGLVTM